MRLEITYREGRPYVGYLDLRRRRGAVYGGSRPVDPGLVLDYSKTGKLMGIEFLAPRFLTAELLDRILEPEGFPPIGRSICQAFTRTHRAGR
jgi:hypothetical protein